MHSVLQILFDLLSFLREWLSKILQQILIVYMLGQVLGTERWEKPELLPSRSSWSIEAMDWENVNVRVLKGTDDLKLETYKVLERFKRWEPELRSCFNQNLVEVKSTNPEP